MLVWTFKYHPLEKSGAFQMREVEEEGGGKI
jgi:hypothetical protein